MKKLLAIIIIMLISHTGNAQSNDYKQLWTKVEKFENDGLPKSALEVVEQIATMAKNDNNAPQQIKTLIYKSKYAMTLEEDAQLKVINDFKSEIAKSEVPVKNVLQNMLATMYWQYFQQNRYRFYERTNTASKVDETDFRTWDLRTLFDEIHLLYKKSLENGLILQQTKIDSFNAIITEHKGSDVLRPTLYDLLAHNALDFYKTDENSITQPAYKFIIDDAKYLSDASTFATLSITSKDSTSLQLNALKLYQKLIHFHLKDSQPEALVDVDIQRLKFVSQHATFPNNEELLLKSFRAGSQKYANQEVSALYDFETAFLLNQQGNRFDPKIDSELQWKKKEALAICAKVIQQFPKSRGAEKCVVLKAEILRPSLRLLSENIIPIQKEALLNVTYSNLNQLQFKIYKFSKSQRDNWSNTHRKEQQLAFIKNLTATESMPVTFKVEGDYQTHSTEIVIPKLNNGFYLMVAKNEMSDSDIFGFDVLQVTDLALINKSEEKRELFQVIDRNNGKPFVGATVKLSYQKNYNGGITTETKTTDNQGEFSISKNNNRLVNLNLEIRNGTGTAYFENYYVNRLYDNQPDSNETQRLFVFTDRSIYRPAQTVHFKGIVMSSPDGKSKVDSNQNVKATLYNVNREILSQQDLKTNEFGSVAGEFILPSDGLTGQFSIELQARTNGSTYFSVEEYKRPKFETTFEPVTETYKVNDSITVNGDAMAYAGSSISNAKVVYRVSRNVQYPPWYYWYRIRMSEPQEIAYGETMTNEKGEFDITFKAIPDESVDKSTLPTFQYEITADVTDINGETRSATTIVNVGYHALTASITVDNKLDKDKKDHKITIDTKNLNGEFVPASGTLAIYKLNAPDYVLRPRPWQAPDYKMLTEAEFKKRFPHEAYDDEANIQNWEQGKKVFETTFDTSKSKEIILENIKKWESGNYVIILNTTDKFGQDVKAEARTFLYSEDDKQPADNQLFTITTDKSEYQPGNNVMLTVGSSAENITVTLDVEKNHEIVKTFIVPLSNSKKTLAIPVDIDDVGGFAIHYSFAVFNSFQSGSEIIAVPYPKTDLEIETITFRDKLQPAQEETWTFKIKGPKGDKVSAELLASMYDMSLDQFQPHEWQFNPIMQPIYRSYNQRNANRSFGIDHFRVYNELDKRLSYPYQAYDQLNWFGFYFGNSYLMRSLQGRVAGVEVDAVQVVSDQVEKEETFVRFSGIGSLKGYDDDYNESNYNRENVSTKNSIREDGEIVFDTLSNGKIVARKKLNENSFDNIVARKNLQETAFFYPQLHTDDEGNVSFSFTTPEALTQWKLQLMAHTKSLESATTTMETVTQKELMVLPNVPRFLRQGDEITISTKISNLTETALSGTAKLELTDGLTGNDISDLLLNSTDNSLPLGEMPKAERAFSVNANGNTQVSWTLTIPDYVEAIQYKILAKAGNFSDGEQSALPVLTNRMLVTETLPMWIRSNETRTFTLDKLKTNISSTLKNHKLTLEMTSNPAWYAVQALPYLMEYPYDCNEQIFSRYYANALASHIANSNPRIQEVFNQWRNTDALLSNLEKNEELKNILIQETPWLRDAQTETEQKKRIALLFDMNKMRNEFQSSLRKLENGQLDNGAWPWFNGGRPNRFITQHIITGFGHLKHLNVDESDTSEMVKRAIQYLDAEFVREYEDIRKFNKDVDLRKDHLSYTQLHYLYMRSFFPNIAKSKEVKSITDYYHTQIQKYWLSRPLYAKGLMAMISHRANDKAMADKILKSLKETSITSDELGMYWKENVASWYWYQAPIETQALMIETFSEIGNDQKTVDNLKIWLLKNKQTNSWRTTKATAEAVYALLLQGSDWLSVTEMVDVVLGGQKISPSKLEDVKVEAGTGYYKTSWDGSEITPEMATVKLTKAGDGIAWGALYWQYFEDLDKITSAETPLSLKKQLFLKTNTDKGEHISAIDNRTSLKVGDLIRVRIELRSDRDMEFIHMKDMRAAGLEPINVLSQYKYQDGLGYYESTKDAATNFFFDYLPKGVYVFEYDLRVNNAGNMSNGITTIQSMYAPEFSSHSEGVRVQVGSR